MCIRDSQHGASRGVPLRVSVPRQGVHLGPGELEVAGCLVRMELRIGVAVVTQVERLLGEGEPCPAPRGLAADLEQFMDPSVPARLRPPGDPDRLQRVLGEALGGDVHDPQPHDVDLGLRAGPYGARKGRAGLTLAKVMRAEHGLDLGPLVRQLPQRLMTERRRIPLAHPAVLADWPRVLAALEELEAGRSDGRDLLMVGRRHLRSNNSWMHNSERLTKGRTRFTVQMHPDDAAERGLADGDTAVVSTDVGSIEAPVEVTDRLMRGVVSVPHGYGHDRAGTPTGWRRAAALGGASVNDITDTDRIDPLSGNARAKMQGVHDGFVKLFCRPGTGIVVGGVVVGPRASELIHPVSVAVAESLTADQLAQAFTVYPSMSGSVAEAARRLHRV